MEAINDEVNRFSGLLADWGQEITEGDREIYACPLCRDTGWVSDGVSAYRCTCQMAEAGTASAGMPPKLARASFSNFRLDYYPPESLPQREISYRKLAERALETMQKFVRDYLAKISGRGVILTGPTGCGKTHLAAAAANALAKQGVEVLFLVVPEFLDQLRDSYRRENAGLSEGELIKRAYHAPVLILDDLGAHNFTEWVQNKLFTIINYRLNHDLPCVITTNLSLKEMDEQIGTRTASRLMEGCVIQPLAAKGDLRMLIPWEARG